MSTVKIRSFDDFLALFPESPRQKIPNGWNVICPAHQDKNPSLSLTLEGLRILVHCKAGCKTEDVLKLKGLILADLFLDSNHRPEANKQKTLVATFRYEHEKGKEAYQIRRLDLGNGSKTFEVWHKKDGQYVSGMGESKKILYHSPEIPEWIAAGKRIYLPEGELKADRIISQGGAATTSPFGAGPNKWKPEYSKALAGAEVIILPDNDKPGRDFAQAKATSLYGIAKTVKVLELLRLPEKGDIIDWLNNGGNAEKLKELVDACPDWTPPGNATILRCMKDVQTEYVTWLWEPYIAIGKLTLLEGDPGIGKSWITLAIATAISLGKGLPGQTTTEPRSVILASAEDGLGDTIRPRLETMKADVGLIHAIDGAITFDDAGFALIENYIIEVKPTLFIIDPLVAYLGAGMDFHRANETRPVMARLAKLAEKYQLAILAVRHLAKGGQNKAIYRGIGSIDFTAACRSMLLAGCDSEDNLNMAIVHIKSNLAQKGASQGYQLRDNGFYWTGESTLTSTQILAGDDNSGNLSEIDEAIAFLKEELADGTLSQRKVYQDAEGATFSKRTLIRAKSQLGILTRHVGEKGKRGGGDWTWELPTGNNDIATKYSGNLNNYEAKEMTLSKNLATSISEEIVPDDNPPDDPPTEPCLIRPREKIIELWNSEGRPVVHLGPGENCFDLEGFLNNKDIMPRHIEAINKWYISKEVSNESTVP